jgi:TolB-like protein/Tfp pilus assembly protein PilF
MMHAVMEVAATANLKLALLGGFEARTRRGDVVDLPGQKDRALLAYLAIAPGDSHSRERLAGLLWSERGDHQARDSLKQALLRLRRSLGAGDGGVLRSDRRSIALERIGIDVDVRTFERLVRDNTIETLAQAASFYRGDLLDGLVVHDPAFEDWLLIERQRLRQLFERALSRLVSHALAAGDRERAAEAARRLLSLDPLSEEAYRTLMRIHAEEGQTAQALKLYDGLWDRLHRELGVRPEPATVALHDQIRRRRSPAAVQNQEPDEGAAAPTPSKPSIAVLPFINLSGDPEQQYFSDGITEDIITELSRFRTLFVIARNSSFRYRGDDQDMRRVGRELGVRYLAEGSVRRAGDRVRISAQLIDAESGDHIWAERYDRDAADLLTVQDDIVRAIATTLGYRVEAAGRERALRLSPDALSAYDLVLRSEALLLRFTKNDNAEAQRLAEKAVALDPRSALAHTQLGWTHCMDYIASWVEDRAHALDMSFALAQRAVLLNEADGRSRWLLGNVHIYRREWEEARSHLLTAIALNPNDVEARGIYGFYLIAVGEVDAALEQFDLAKRHNPFEFNWVIWYRGIALFTARRYDEAIAVLKQVHNPSMEVRCWLAASYAAAGRVTEARAMLAEFLAVAEGEMARFPGRDLDRWEPHLHGFVAYRDPREFDHLLSALHTAGLQ